jgi:hypothetical protein
MSRSDFFLLTRHSHFEISSSFITLTLNLSRTRSIQRLFFRDSILAVDLSNFANGLYLAQINFEHALINRKIIIRK